MEHRNLMPFVFHDGGRSKYFKGTTRDCVCRAVAIAGGLDYKEVYNAIFKATGSSPRNPVFTKKAAFKRLMLSLGFTWTPCAGIGSPIAIHPVVGELPEGRLVCSAAGHYFAVIDGVVYDTWDSRYNSFGEVRRVYGYWKYNK